VEIDTTFRRLGANFNARLQWRDKEGSSLLLAPGFFGSTGDGNSHFRFTETSGAPQPSYDHGVTDSENSFGSLRLNVDARRRVGSDWRLEANGSVASTRWSGHSLRRELDRAGALTRTEQVDSRGRERIANTTTKASRLLGADSGHSLVLGSEFEHLRRDELRVTLNNGVHQFGEDDDDLAATVQRIALYVQDEWTITPGWSAHAGLRSETITTRGDDLGGASPVNRSRVTTPLLHVLYKPDPKKRDQVRLSLTRSYKSPTLANLIGRPAVSSRFPLPGANTPTFADRAGNPDLRPELATGLDLAFERYLDGGGVLSANLFARRLSDYIRNLTRLEGVDYAPVPRYVSRPSNLGRARTQGVELEAKFRLDQAIAEAPPVDLRANLSAYRSRVEQVPGPDNRLDAQPKATLNLGADYRFRAVPLTIGGNLNLVPAYRTQASDVLASTTPRKRQFDAHALWVFNPAMQLRLNLTNLLPEDFATATIVETTTLRERQVNTQRTDLGARLTLELKL
jgi:iron complex outermembrane receptor protein